MSGEMKPEIVRKLFHFSVALSVPMTALSLSFTLIFLLAGTVCYCVFEFLRFRGVKVPLISALTSLASRPREKDSFVLGPLTLGAGAFLSFLLFPPMAASIAVCALAFGDGFAALAGKLFGRHRPRFLFGKSIEGSLVCFAAVFISSYLISKNPLLALFSALTAMLAESLPLGDFDNVFLPLAVGMVVLLLM